MLHVPCILHDQLLTLYKYISLPFPIPKFVTSDTPKIADLIEKRTGYTQVTNEIEMDVLIIVPEAEMIAVSNNAKFRKLSQWDLALCNRFFFTFVFNFLYFSNLLCAALFSFKSTIFSMIRSFIYICKFLHTHESSSILLSLMKMSL